MWDEVLGAASWRSSARCSRARLAPPFYRAHPDRHAVRVVARRRSSTMLGIPRRTSPSLPRASTPGSPRASRKSRAPAHRHRRPAHADQAVRRDDPRGARGPRRPPRPRAGHRRRRLRARRARGRSSTTSTPAAGSAWPATSPTTSSSSCTSGRGCVTRASTAEGWGMTLTEAAACGTPAVATGIAGHRDSVADGKSGLLVDSSRDMVDRDHPAASTTTTPARRLSEGARKHAAAVHLGGGGVQRLRAARPARPSQPASAGGSPRP